jgi:hypothetical protein
MKGKYQGRKFSFEFGPPKRAVLRKIFKAVLVLVRSLGGYEQGLEFIQAHSQPAGLYLQIETSKAWSLLL